MSQHNPGGFNTFMKQALRDKENQGDAFITMSLCFDQLFLCYIRGVTGVSENYLKKSVLFIQEWC